MTYEEYCGGQASPNTEYPQEIKNVEGNVDFVVCNKNLWDEDWENGYFDANGGSIPNTNAVRSKNFIKVEPNTDYYFYNGTNSNGRINFYDKNKNVISSSTIFNQTKTTPENCYYIKFSTGIDYNTTYKNDICINVSNLANNGTYTPHQSKTITFPLADGQKLMEGDYLADDGVHHIRGQIVLDGSSDEEWTCPSKYDDYSKVMLRTSVEIPNVIGEGTARIGGGVSSHFIGNTTIYANNAGIGYYYNNTNKLVLAILMSTVGATTKNTTAECLELFKNWIANNNVIIENQLAIETVDPYTPAQQEAYNQLQKLMLNHGTNHVWTETDGLNPNIKVTYKQSHKIKSQKEIEDIKNAIISMGGNI